MTFVRGAAYRQNSHGISDPQAERGTPAGHRAESKAVRTVHRLTRFLVVSATTAAIGAASTLTAHAEPRSDGIRYTAQVVGDAVVLTTDSGSLDTAGDQLEIRDDAGVLRASFPLGYYQDNRRWPVAARVDGTTATLTPSVDPATATPAPGVTDPLHEVALDPESPEFTKALENFTAVVGVGTALGTLIGTVVGAGLGCVVGGALVGGAATIPTIGVLTIPGFLGGCLVTAIPVAAIGGVLGTIGFGIPAVVIGGFLLGDALTKQNAAPPKP
ncbi:hypothetical protein [Nocardia brasiliensis]|uniref:DUF8020 domain-containing protein n=1 Tax=Nocardia brasiliensis (strain ATCC 700358 / HUJEG-1) TaxID=1133849 RepID=K0ETC9_NOCB7|nr:hypothetical protein [Nocardia brasiliensis]AFU00712.1 hypothetical protein O3I_013755 [Nocardia brasiliensis ATCC 700358]OCF83972.1 hypothetical protein AW168_02345 [Nocardia brasiliensis]